MCALSGDQKIEQSSRDDSNSFKAFLMNTLPSITPKFFESFPELDKLYKEPTRPMDICNKGVGRQRQNQDSDATTPVNVD